MRALRSPRLPRPKATAACLEFPDSPLSHSDARAVAPLRLRPHGSPVPAQEFAAASVLSASREVLYHRARNLAPAPSYDLRQAKIRLAISRVRFNNFHKWGDWDPPEA